MQTNSDFEKLVNDMNEISNQENRAELEGFYTLHATTLQFFKAIDKAIQDVLKKSNVGETVIKQLENALPTLTKLKKEISKLDSETFAVGYKTKISQSVTNIKNGMTLSEANDTAREFFDLLKENKDAIIAVEQENKRKEKEAAERKAEEKARKQGEGKNQLHKKAVKLFEQKRYIEAIAYYDEILKLEPNDFTALEMKAHSLHYSGKDEEAVTCFKKAIKLDRTREMVYYSSMAVSLSALKRYEEAISCYDKMLELEPNDTGRHCTLAAKKQCQDALNDTRKGNSGCFVATACYGNYNSSEVLILRTYRDEHLLTNWLGTVFVKFYYFVSPPLARQIEKSGKVKSFLRKYFLKPIVDKINKSKNN